MATAVRASAAHRRRGSPDPARSGGRGSRRGAGHASAEEQLAPRAGGVRFGASGWTNRTCPTGRDLELDLPKGLEALRVPETVTELYVARVTSPDLSINGTAQVKQLRVEATRALRLQRLHPAQAAALRTLHSDNLALQPGFALPLAPDLSELLVLGRRNHPPALEELLAYKNLTKCVLHLEHEVDADALRHGHLERLVVFVKGRPSTLILPSAG